MWVIDCGTLDARRIHRSSRNGEMCITLTFNMDSFKFSFPETLREINKFHSISAISDSSIKMEIRVHLN